MSDELKERNILKLILIVGFACATLDMGHPIKTRDMISTPHLSYSADMAPRDFYLSFTLKQRLEHTSITDKDQSFEELHTILREIPGEELERFFEAWRECVHNVNLGDGGYID
jgi:hypothetical protein